MIKIVNVNKNFKRRKLFKDLNLEIPLNQITFILGKSGSGKSTILNLIGSIESVDKGEILLETNDQKINLLDKKNHFLIDYIFQDYNLLKDLNAIDNIKVGNSVVGKDFSKEECLSAFEKFNINKESYKNKVHSLSGGEQQRVAVLRTLSRDSQILLVDEPTGNLDNENSKIIFETLKEISKTKTVIVVTHDVKNAETYGDNIVKVRDGKIESFEKIKSIDESKAPLAISNSQTVSKNYKWNNKLKILPNLVITDLKKKWIQTSAIILTFFISIFSLIIFSLLAYSSINIRDKSIVSSNADLIIVEKKSAAVKPENFNNQLLKKSLTQEEIDKIEKIPGIDKIFIPSLLLGGHWNNFNTEIFPSFIYEGREEKDISYEFEQVDNSSFFSNRIAVLDRTSGSYIQNDDEIIISKTVVNNLKIIDPINKKIIIKFNNSFDKNLSFQKEFKIVGIYNPLPAAKPPKDSNSKQDNAPPKMIPEPKVIENIITKNAAEEVEKMEKQTTFSLIFHSKPFPSIYPLFTVNQKETIVEGVAPTQLNEILISTALVQSLSNNFNLNVKINDTIELEPAYRKTVVDKKINFKIVGFFENRTGFIKTNSQTLASFSSEKTQPIVELFINKNTNSTNVIDELKKISPNFDIEDVGERVRQRIYLSTLPIIIVSSIIFSLMAIISLILVLTYSKLLIDGKKREIGILRLLGGKSFQVLLYHVSNLFFINIISLILITIFYYPGFLLLDWGLEITSIINPKAGTVIWIIIVCWLTFSLFNILIYTAISLKTFRSPVKNLLY